MVSPFTRQIFVALSPLFAGLSVGGAMTYPSVLLHQLKREDSLIQLDFETASWIGAIHGLAGLPSILMPAIMQWMGRKFAFIVACLISITGWIIAFFARTATAILVSESFHGLGSNSIYAVTCLSMTEMIAPNYRDTYIQMYYILGSVSMAFNGLIAHHLHWKAISIVMGLPMVLAVSIALFWPESPYWLACKGQFDECERVFIWLRGSDAASMKELQELLTAKRENLSKTRADQKSLWNTITSRDFYVPCAHTFVLEYLLHGMGFLVVLIYSIELFQKATGNNSIAIYGGFIISVIQILGIAVSIVLCKYFRKNAILLWGIFGAVVGLSCASAVTFLQSTGYLSERSYLGLYCLIVYEVAMGMSILPVAYPVASALLPVKHRGLGGVLYVTNTCMLHTMFLKLAPYLLSSIKLYGTFLLFAMNGVICGLLIWRFIPETKGRTLQEIEDYYVHGKFVRNSQKEDSNCPMLRSNTIQ